MDDYVKLDLVGDPEQANELRRLQRKRMIADMLMQKSMQPIQGQMVGDVYVPPSPMQGVAQLFNAYMSNKGNTDVDAGYQALGEKRKAEEAVANAKYMQGMTGTPEQTFDPLTPMDDEGNVMPAAVKPAQPATQEQKMATVREAILSNLPRQQRMGQFDFSAMNAELARKEAAQNKLEQLKVQAEARAEAQRERQDFLKALQDAKLSAGGAAVTPVTIEDPKDSNKTIVIDARTNRKLGQGPKLTAIGSAEYKKQLATEEDQKSALMALRTAGYDPTTGKDKISELIDESTSGIVQRAGAAIPGAFGVSTSGMKAIRTVESTANSIVLDLMNRKLGAGISNADREFIVSQLGDVGNAMKPAGERKAAWTAAKNRMIEVGLHPAVGMDNSIPDAPPPGSVRRKNG